MSPTTQIVATVILAIVGLFADRYNARKTAVDGGSVYERMGAVLSYARDAVLAAEKLGQDHGYDGESKYDFVAGVIVDFAHRLKLNLSEQEVSAAIHAVLVEVDGLKPASAPELKPVG